MGRERAREPQDRVDPGEGALTPSVLVELGQRQISELADELGLVAGRRGTWSCPACRATLRGARPERRGPVGVARSGRGWRCHRCGEQGDGGHLVCWALLGRRCPGADGALDLEAWAEGRGLCVPRGRPSGVARAYSPPPPPEPEAPPAYPPPAALADLRRALAPASWWDGPAAAWWAARGFGGPAARRRARVGVLARSWAPLPRGYPLVLPLVDAAGEVRSVHGRRADEQRPKTANPRGYGVAGLFFADTTALRLLRGTPPASGLALVVEGATDYLRACSIAPPDVAIFGGISGSFATIGRLPLPPTVLVATDADRDGDRYAELVYAGCPAAAVRCRPPEGSDLDSSGWTWDMLVSQK